MSVKKHIPEEIVILSSDEDEDFRNPLADVDDKVIALDSDEAEIISSSPPRIVSPSLLAKLTTKEISPRVEKATVVKTDQDDEEAILPDIQMDDEDTRDVPPVATENPIIVVQVNNKADIVTATEENVTKAVVVTATEENVTKAAIVTTTEENVVSSSVVSTTTEGVLDMEVEDQVKDEVDSSVSCDSKPLKLDVDNGNADSKPDEVACSSSSYVPDVPKAAAAMERLVEAVKKRTTRKEYPQVKDRLWRKYGLLEFKTPEFENTVFREIDACANELLLSPENKWKKLKSLLDFLKMCHENPAAALVSHQAEVPDVEKDSKTEARKEKKIRKLEVQLQRCEEKIEEWDKKDDNWDDDFNSPYLVTTRLRNKLMKVYTTLCKVTGSNTLTGRPTQKKVNMAGMTRFPELDVEVEKVLNSKGALFTPDYHDMLKITKSVNTGHNLFLSQDEVEQTALDLFQRVVKLLKKRRHKDVKLALRIDDFEGEDPADADPELARKLEENRTKGKLNEDKVISEFAAKQEELKLVAKEIVEENADDSAKESDDEDEDPEVEALEFDGSGGSVVQEDDENGCEEQVPGTSTSNGHNGEGETIDLVDSESSSSDEDVDTPKLREQNGSPKVKRPRLENTE